MHHSCRLSYCQCIILWFRLLRYDTLGLRVKVTPQHTSAAVRWCCWLLPRLLKVSKRDRIAELVTGDMYDPHRDKWGGDLVWNRLKPGKLVQSIALWTCAPEAPGSDLDTDAYYRHSVFLWFSSVSGDRRGTVAGDPDLLRPHALRLTVLSSNRSTPYCLSRWRCH